MKTAGANPASATMNTSQIGEAAEAFILSKLLSLGYAVSIPFGNNQRYDMVVDDGEKLLKAQCKSGRNNRGDVIKFNACSINGFTKETKTYKHDVDIFLVYCDNEVYWIPIKDVPNKEGYLRVTPAKNGMTKGIKYATDYKV